MGFAKARFKLIGVRSELEGIALVDTGAWYTIVDKELAEKLGVKYMELSVVITSFSGQKIKYREAIVESLLIEGKIHHTNWLQYVSS